MRILITCFMPFRGRSKNGSQVLARHLMGQHLQSSCPADEVRLADIPVRWGAVESTLSPVIENWQPDVVLGLGEGGPATIAIETTGRNIRRGEDVDGTPPPDAVILENSEPERNSRFSFAWTYQMPLAFPIKLSLDAGAYLCNNALYFICGTECKRVGFVHIPPQGDDSDETYCDLYGPVLLEILRQNTNSTLVTPNDEQKLTGDI